jgi:hypothetical protein
MTAIRRPRYACISRSESGTRSVPFNRIRPAVIRAGTGKSFSTAQAVIDFPAPDPPTSATNLPDGTSSETSSSTTKSPLALGIVTESPSIRSSPPAPRSLCEEGGVAAGLIQRAPACGAAAIPRR